MDLKIKDVADLLHVSETTVRRWVSDGKIPAYRLNKQYRFSRNEVEDWVLSQKIDLALPRKELASQKGETEKTGGIKQFSLYRAMHRGDVFLDIQAKDKGQALSQTMHLLAGKHDLDAELVTKLLLDRERLMPTALGGGIAVPHTRDFLLPGHYDMIAVVFLRKAIPYGALDQQKIHTLFFLFACEDKRHLNLLAKLAYLSDQEGSQAFFRTRPDKAALLQYVRSWESQIN